MMTRTQKLPDI